MQRRHFAYISGISARLAKTEQVRTTPETRMSKQVLVWPSPWNYRLKNAMFTARVWTVRLVAERAFILWREQASQAGIEVNTWDMKPLSEADILMVHRPSGNQKRSEARSKAGHQGTKRADGL